jgi:hypothetical protein
MKKIYPFLAIILALVILSMQKTTAQVTVWVHVTPDCPDICTTHEDCVHYVEYEVWEVCHQPPQKVCWGNKQEDCSVDPIIFNDCDYDCSELPNNPCFLVIATAYKKCIGPGGTTIICNGRGSKYVSTCYLLMNTTNDVYIEWQ